MVTINCTHNEQLDFENYLEELKEFKRKNRPKGKNSFDSTDYDIERINILIQRVKGNYQECYIQNSKEFREKNGRISEREVLNPQKIYERTL